MANETQPTHLSMEQGPSLEALPTPAPQAEGVAPMVLASNQTTSAAERLAAQPSPAMKAEAETYSVSVKAPPAGGMLAYLVGPGAQIELVGIDLNSATLAQEAGNLRITLANGAEVLLLDYVASAKDPATAVITEGGKLPAQQLLAALDEVQLAQNVADVEPAAGPASGAGGSGGGLTPPTILGTGVGEGEGIFSSVIGPFALGVPYDEIRTEDLPFEPGVLVLPADQLPPLAQNDMFSGVAGRPTVIAASQLLANDSDPEGDPISVISVQGLEAGTGASISFDPLTGQVTINAGTMPDPNNPGQQIPFQGTASFSYTITDGNGGTSTADVLIQIDPDPLTENNVIAADDAETVVSGGTVKVNVLANDIDPEGDALVPGSVRIITQPTSGSVTVNPDGSISYSADPSITTRHFVSFVYEVSDDKGARDTATVTIEVLPIDNTLVAVDDTGFIQPAGAVKSFNVVNNDVDPQGDSFTITSIGTPKLANGTVVGTASFDAASGLITYNSVASSTGYTVTIEYTITDARGATATATLTVNVQPEGQNSVEARDDTADMLAGQSVNIDVLRNDVDPQGDSFSIKPGSLTQPMEGNVARGSVAIVDGKIVFTDDANARNSGVVEFSYTIIDARGAEDTAVVRVTIGTAPNGVDANNDTFSLAHNAAETNITATLRANDFDAQGDAFTITSVSALTIGQGTLRLDNGQVFFTPANGYTGPVVFSYTITDARGATDTAEVYINVQPPVPDQDATSVFAGNDNFTTKQDVPLTITSAEVLANDYDPEGSTLARGNIISYTQSAHGTVSRDATTGDFVFTPASGFTGTTSFTYTIEDADGDRATATVVIRVDEPGALDNPVDAVNDLLIVNPGQIKTINVLANDSAPDGGLAFVRVVGSLPAGVTDLGNGVFRYDATNDTDSKTITFQYEARDVDGDTDIATVTIRVEDRPVDAVDDVIEAIEDTPMTFTTARLLENDSAPDGGLAFVRVVGNLPAGLTYDSTTGIFSYTPPANFHGDVSFQYEARDIDGDTDIATVTIRVASVNDPVDAVNDMFTTEEDTRLTFTTADLLANDSAPDGGLAFVRTVGNLPAGLSFNSATGQFTYDPPANFNGTVSFQYEARDIDGDTDIATVTIVVTPVNDPVNAEDDAFSVRSGTTLTFTVTDLLANDFAGDGGLAFTNIVGNLPAGLSFNSATGQFTYNAPVNFAGNVSFQYAVRDVDGDTDVATVTITVLPNSVDARDDFVTMPSDVNSILIDAIANDVDPQGDAFSITRIVSVSSGSASIENGQVRYTNPTRDAGTATIVYEITDQYGAKDTATITVNIQADTNNVVAQNDTYSTTAGQTIQFNVLGNDYDPQGDTFELVGINGAPAGLVYNGGGNFTFTGQGRDAYDTSFTYVIRDSRGAESTATVYLHVSPAANNVVAQDDSFSGLASFSTNVLNVTANDYDPQGDSFTISRIVSGPSVGSAYVSGNNIVYNSTESWTGYTTTLVYEIRDSRGATSTATVSIQVNPVNNGGGISNGNESDSSGNGSDRGDCPLVIDLNGDGISVVMQAGSKAHFDLNGDGHAEWTAWVNGADDAILAIDRNGNGSIDGIHEVFGGKGMDGFTELAHLEDTNKDGVIDANDANWSQLRLWLDKNGDGITDDGELFTLDYFGITAINLGTTDVSIQYGDAYINKMGTVTLADGSTLDAGTVFYTNTSNGHLIGTASNDVLIYSAMADSIDGGQGADTLKVLTASDVVLSHDVVKGIEAIDLANNGADKLKLNINDVLTMSDTGILTIQGDAVDEITLTGDATRGSDVTQNGHTYASYTAGNGGTVLVELGLTVHQENQH